MRTLNIRWKFILSSYGIMLLTVIILNSVISFSLKKNLEQEVNEFRNFEVKNVRQQLKNNVDIAYRLLEEAEAAVNTGRMTLADAKKDVLNRIENLRYDSGAGYFWINDTGKPYPKMIMHPTLPELDGKILDDPKFNCAQGQGKNLFVAMREVSEKNGEGFVDYLWPKPTQNGLTAEQPKLSYVRRYDSFDWIIGTGRYIDDIDAAVEIKHININHLISSIFFEIFAISLAVLILAFVPLVLLSKALVAPILQCINFANEVENGNLSGLVEFKRQDETGTLAHALNSMVITMRKILSDVYQHSALVVLTSNKLAATSEKMTATSKRTSEQTDSVAEAAEQASANIISVSDTVVSLARRAGSIAVNTSDMSEMVNSVASSVEQMSNSFKDVAVHCNNAQRAAGKNLETGDLASTRIKDLNETVNNIGSVIMLIEEITEQTKLLALNATIEAARAGEAGKGFSVVASEVKELAGQTAKATETIAERIKEMQDKTEDVVKMIKGISDNNQDLNEINTSIAATVEEQSATAVEIARAVAETARSSVRVSEEVQEITGAIEKEISTNIKAASTKVADVSSSIQTVSEGVKKNAGAAAGNVAFARELANVAAVLRKSFSEFNLGFRKFDIGMIKAAHLAWRLHLEAMLHQGVSLSLDEIPDHTQCDFGKWLATNEAQELKPLEAYPEMITLHENIHSLAYRIADYYHDGHQEKATSLMKEFNKTSEKLFAALDALYIS